MSYQELTDEDRKALQIGREHLENEWILGPIKAVCLMLALYGFSQIVVQVSS